jgi:hypothetical protein
MHIVRSSMRDNYSFLRHIYFNKKRDTQNSTQTKSFDLISIAVGEKLLPVVHVSIVDEMIERRMTSGDERTDREDSVGEDQRGNHQTRRVEVEHSHRTIIDQTSGEEDTRDEHEHRDDETTIGQTKEIPTEKQSTHQEKE